MHRPGIALPLLLAAAVLLPLTAAGPAAAEGPTTAPAPTFHFPWERDYARAAARAEAEGKDLLISFTGSDWCGYCIQLDREVFQSPAFARQAGRYFVFLLLDFPQDPDLQARVPGKPVRDKLQRDLGVEGFPTVWLTTSRGTPYAQTGYQEGGPEAYLANLMDLRGKGDRIRPLLRAGQRADVATIQGAMPTLLEGGLIELPHYAWVLERACAVDPEGRHGLRQQAERVRELNRMMAMFRAGPEWAQIHAFLQSARFIRNEHKYASACALTAERWLLPAGRYAEARAMVQRAQATPALEGNSWAQGEFQRVMDLIDAAQATPAPAGTGR